MLRKGTASIGIQSTAKMTRWAGNRTTSELSEWLRPR